MLRELYVERGCIMWGYSLVIPSTLRNTILKQLHVSHLGLVKTKLMAQSCEVAQYRRRHRIDTLAKHVRWKPYLAQPWSRLHVDFLGPYQGKTFFVIIDSSTKWIEIFEMNKTNGATVIKVMGSLFARFGLPLEVVSDQGPPFTSAE